MRRVPLLLLLCGAVAADVQDLQSRVFHARDRVLPALVNVQVVTETFRGGRRRQMTAGGSGVVVSADGLVVTNFHVAGHAKKVFCTLADKTRVRAELHGGDPSTASAPMVAPGVRITSLSTRFLSSRTLPRKSRRAMRRRATP